MLIFFNKNKNPNFCFTPEMLYFFILIILLNKDILINQKIINNHYPISIDF